ncbi:MAG: hypothetical protein ABI355_16320 [Solirubrobacteraceae bacterium]
MSDREPPLNEEPAGHSIPAVHEPGAESGSSALPAEREPAGEVTSPAETPVQQPAASTAPAEPETAPNMLPGRPSRGSGLERFVVRLVATGGVIGIGVGIAAILAANHVQGWIIGLAVSAVSVLLSAILWSSRQM